MNGISRVFTLRMRSFRFAVVLMYGVVSAVADPPPVEIYSTPYWLIAGALGKITWVEIHNLAQAPVSGVAHLEILARKQGAHRGEIEHVCSHLAITTEALRRSVIRPYKTLGVYPESYFGAYERWKAEEKQGRAIVCSTSIQEFLKEH